MIQTFTTIHAKDAATDTKHAEQHKKDTQYNVGHTGALGIERTNATRVIIVERAVVPLFRQFECAIVAGVRLHRRCAVVVKAGVAARPVGQVERVVHGHERHTIRRRAVDACCIVRRRCNVDNSTWHGDCERSAYDEE